MLSQLHRGWFSNQDSNFLPEHVFEAGLVRQAAGVDRAVGREVGGQTQEHFGRPQPRGPGVRGIRLSDAAIVVDVGTEQADRAQAANHPQAEVLVEASGWTKVKPNIWGQFNEHFTNL